MAGNIYRSKTLAACGVAAAVALMGTGSAHAATTLFSTSFEAPAFAAGKSVADTANTGAFTPFITGDVTGGVGSATVFTYGTVFGGSSTAQLVQVNDTGGITANTSAFYLPSSTAAVASPGVIDSVVQIAVNGGGSGGATFGLTSFDNTAAQGVVSDFEINAATGAVTLNGLTTPVSATTFTAPTTGTFFNYELQLNYATQTASVFEAAMNVGTFPSTPIVTAPFEETASTFSTTGFDTFAVGGTAGTGVAEFDNLTITSVPEPVSASLLFGGVLLAGGRRRRQSSAR